MADAVFIGVDSGASKTHVVALDAQGAVIGQARGAAATLNGQADTAWATIEIALGQLGLSRGRPADDWHVVVGIAGTELSAAFDDFVAAAPIFASCRVVSDAHIACAGAHGLTDGAIVAVGTGLVGFSRRAGTPKRAGGWGFPHDDRGAGAWLGLEAVAHALAVADGRDDSSMLSEWLLAPYDHDPLALSAWACTARAGDFARLARGVVTSAQAGDARAESLLRAAGAHVSTLARALIGAHDDLGLALVGGLADTVTPYLDSDLRARLIAPRYTPAHGAALMARHGASEVLS
ncbi:BadF/BadG/BcrA/BcrD ATPase family protein [Salinisphaera japonica]|uniref:BadF/BadG/BcrA/BcrD type ATPase n=1 Tax=Salinisphaera japonica YTM-1 TaxID=1209778 RepID=A0A423Q0A5_9GAMM|nr:BadF/BadG/BcrA/BcrD ATPase family protein [Salinisphaera japonica]ROO31403.1 BadF/BadG/BcrA/BcrD type ATPase [Salinisphaera japonica YTM-1]